MSKQDCPHCGGMLQPGTTSYVANRNGYHLIIDNARVLVCEQCHEALYTEEAVRHIQKILHTLDAQRKELDSIVVTH